MAEAEPAARVSILARIGNGVLLPVAFFVGWQYILIASTSGTGSWAGMTVFFASLFVVPALLVLDMWVVLVRWRGHFRCFFAGLALPAVVGAFEAWLMFGKKTAASGRAFDQFVQSPWAVLAVLSLCLPLVAAIVHSLYRRSGSRQTKQESRTG